MHFLSSDAGIHLLALRERADLVSSGGRAQKAEAHLSHAVARPSQPPLPTVPRAARHAGGRRKLTAIDAHAGPRRPRAWIDDDARRA